MEQSELLDMLVMKIYINWIWKVKFIINFLHN